MRLSEREERERKREYPSRADLGQNLNLNENIGSPSLILIACCRLKAKKCMLRMENMRIMGENGE